MAPSRPFCACCSGTGLIEAYTGGMRPCSRCRIEDFHAWYRSLCDATFAEKAEQAGRS